MPKFLITYVPNIDGTSATDEVVAEYCVREEPKGNWTPHASWTTFKDAGHKVVADVPSGGIRMIRRIDAD